MQALLLLHCQTTIFANEGVMESVKNGGMMERMNVLGLMKPSLHPGSKH